MKKTYYWSLVLTSYYASVALWSREGEETAVVAYGPEVSWEKEDELAAAVDTSLSEVSSQMPEEAGEPTKTVFGVMSEWVSEGHIKKHYLTLIREICGKLSLSPVGFVILPEAVAHEVKQNEGGPLSGIVIGVGRETLEVSLFRMGNLTGTVEVGRSMSLSEDLIEALGRFSSNDPLPSRFILYGAGRDESQDISHLLSSVTWKTVHDKLAFLHEPKIEVSGNERMLVSICVAGSSEMGPVKSLVLPQKGDEETEESNVVASDMALNDLGFAVDADISRIAPDLSSDEEESTEEDHGRIDHVARAPRKFHWKTKILGFFQRPSSDLPVERAHIVHARHSEGKLKRVGIIAGALSLLLLIVVFGAWYFLPRAEITIYISPRTLTSREMFTLRSDTEEPDIESKVLPVVEVHKSVSGEENAPSTGTKTVGEKATGKVTIRNGTSNAVKLPAGALLTGPNDLKFTIDQSASVSAAVSTTEPGSVTVSATAATIGSESNIAKDSSLKVGSFLPSEIDAVVADSFAGGTSRQISAVSKSDLDALEKSLTQKLMADAQNQMVEEVPEDNIFVNDAITTKTTSKTFDHKVGDEASTINLRLDVEVSGFSVPKSAITKTAQKLLESQVPDGYSFRPEQVETSFDLQKGTNSLVANIGFTAHLLPDVNPDSVAKDVAGKRFTAANNYLSTIPGFVRATITQKPAFPTAIRFTPFNAQKITVQIQAEK